MINEIFNYALKLNCKIVILSFFLFCNTYSQFYGEEEISPSVLEFMEIANEFSKSYDPVTNSSNMEFRDDEIEHIAELYYRAYEEDPVGFNSYVASKHELWKKYPMDVRSGKLRKKPWQKIYNLRNQISYKYGVVFTEVIGTSAFLRGKFLELTFTDFNVVSIDTLFFKAHTYNFIIEDVLKGNKFFEIGDTISIKMIPNVENPRPEFISVKSYLIPVKTFLDNEKNTFNMVFGYLQNSYGFGGMGVPPKTFPIENEIIIDCEYFGIKDTNWVDFKDYFKQTFLIFN